jgi:N-acetylmuramic acid 6-phosphate (MurNAc-6-P) etherase
MLSSASAWGSEMNPESRRTQEINRARQTAISTETMLLDMTPSQATPYVAALDHSAACDGATAGLSNLSLFNAYAQLAHAIIQVSRS